MGAVTKQFMWQDRDGDMHDPANMRTSHIFFCLRMIWNHTAPVEYRIEPYQRYALNPKRFTREYTAMAIRCLMTELSKRDDLTPYFIKCLRIMTGHLQLED